MLKKGNFILIVTVVLAFFFRLQNINWDSGFHLHPDERFLTMVGTAMKIPSGLIDYLTPDISPMNPANIGYGFFVYGTLPLVVVKYLAVLFSLDNYQSFTLLGRAVTGLMDSMVVLMVFFSVKMLEEKKLVSGKIKYLAAFFYAISVLPIQYAHFFTTDVFLNFFLFASFFTSLLFYRSRSLRPLVIAGLCFGMAIASKINAVYILPLLLCILLYHSFIAKNYLEGINTFIIFATVCYIAVRIGAPYYFQNPNPFDASPNSLFVQNLIILKSFEAKNASYPPGLQWIHTAPLFFPVLNMALFGLGLPLFLLFVVGLFRVIGSIAKKPMKKAIPMGVIAGWVILVFLYQSVQFVKVMRYFLFLYPFFAVYSALGAETVMSRFPKKRYLRTVLFMIFAVMLWPLLFSSIYFIRNTRVAASEWMYKHIPDGAKIISEYWDDPLPISVSFPPPKTFQGEQIPIFDPDTSEKWNLIQSRLKTADYYVLSSNRGWGTLLAIPDRYPLTAKFYLDLFEGKTDYSLIKSFYPPYYPCGLFSLVCPRILSSLFDESFTVYDHPTVYIFKRNE